MTPNEKKAELLSKVGQALGLAIKTRLLVPGEEYTLIILDDKEFQFFRVGDVPTNYVIEEVS